MATSRVVFEGHGIRVLLREQGPGLIEYGPSSSTRHWIWSDGRYKRIPPHDEANLSNPEAVLMRFIEVSVA